MQINSALMFEITDFLFLLLEKVESSDERNRIQLTSRCEELILFCLFPVQIICADSVLVISHYGNTSLRIFIKASCLLKWSDQSIHNHSLILYDFWLGIVGFTFFWKSSFNIIFSPIQCNAMRWLIGTICFLFA